MKKFIEFLKKYKIHILTSLLVIFFFRSCSKSGDVRKLEKANIRTTKIVDSLTTVIKGQKDTINNISEVIRVEKIKIHTEYDNYISSKNRGEQLMELHKIVKQNLKNLEK
jgi:PBP1b-binding outer membrane lipoprotein LpoB